MTLQQLRYAIEIEKWGSLSKAAKKLFVSQPNLSTSIKDLETEMGITIFKRNNRGIQVTEKGQTFLLYAQSILNQCEEMKHFSTNTNSSSFRLIAQNYSPVMESFIKYVKLNSNNENFNFELINAQGFEVIDKVYKQEADLGIFIIVERKLENFIDHLKDRNLTYVSLGKLSFYVNVRQGHPILKHKDSLFYELHKYPFVHYKESIYNQYGDIFDTEEFNFINFDKEISVFDRDVKCKIVNETDAYGIGCKLHPNFSKNFNWVLIPIPDIYVEIGHIHSSTRPMSIESQTYINILKEELNGLIL
ncbi:LysR family transcriptional regulator [Anaeromicrobium sediminis]|uniref:HTH lysR-type domain-containing protein n=1 Tax=Anaeromicrobium sediminis TaxID=1478221 RepID=A0A267MLD8_9FIRM|nr:LysR family transcriptional regulator [Anaeromicrobium sediminis]PAB59613.1 hypothetical protein CCE28_08570 [Anaeromicrobium sediminis]